MKYLCFFHFVLLKLNVSNCCHTKNLCLYIIFYLKIKNKINLSSKMYSLLQWCKVTNNCFLCIYISSFYMENNKAQTTIQEKRIEDILFFYKLVEIQLKCVLVYQALWQIKTKEEAQKYMHTNLFFFPL